MLQLSSSRVENPRQVSKLGNIAVVDFTLLTNQSFLAEAVRQQVPRCDAKLAASQRHFFVFIASQLLSLISPATLARYVSRKFSRDNGYQCSFCNAILLQSTIVSALTLLFLTERRRMALQQERWYPLSLLSFLPT